MLDVRLPERLRGSSSWLPTRWLSWSLGSLVCATLGACSRPHVDDGRRDLGISGDGAAGAPDLAPPAPRLGGQLTATGATFHVWAPGADQIVVTGDFDSWGGVLHPP